ncbi:hypothetical protein GA0115246_114962 [Streptomyces sp. SolWspMP-sol7th]|nr:hypothetical protein GA0115246_114962 [Streptomyces sp. SolWspMP-sol7th]
MARRSHQPKPSPRGARQPAYSIAGTSRAAKSHSGGSSRRSRPRITDTAGRASERAMSEPASANITPMEGNTTLSQAQPKTW